MTPLRSMFFIDGFNVYHSLRKRHRQYLWLNFMELAHHISIPPYEKIESVKYFSAFATWRPESYAKHKMYVSLLEGVGVEVILGRFQEKQRKCTAKGGCSLYFTMHEEKHTDVNIALSILETCISNQCDKIYLISGDNDFVPALRAAKRVCANIQITVVLPINARAENIKRICRDSQYDIVTIKEKILSGSQFSDIVSVGEDKYQRPETWNEQYNWVNKKR